MSGHPDQNSAPSKPPPAPPLPPQSRYGHRAATAIARFAHPFFAGSRNDTQRHGVNIEDQQAHVSKTEPTQPATLKNEAIHKTGIPISAVDISPDRTRAILAGREILKTIRVEGATCTEEFNLRSGIINYASTHDSNRDAVAAGHKDQLAAVDVKWSHGSYDTTVATAAANGRIMIYDLNRPSIEIARLHEHNRQVHRIAFNPHHPAFLLSASQDGTVRLWDMRALGGGEKGGRSVKTCSSSRRYPANSEGVRDVKWSPHDGYTFAIGTENGSVQKWSLSNEKAPILRLHGHDRLCSAIDWHPDGRYLASASTDKLVKIWDFGSEDRRMKAINQIRTPQAVTQMHWRPNVSTSSGSLSDFNYMTTQISTSYDAKDPRIHVWDLQRPNVPVLELEKYDTPATSLVWHSRDLLWSVGQTGTFTQNDLKLAYRPTKRHTSPLAIGVHGRIAFFSSAKSRLGMVAESLVNRLEQRTSYTEQGPNGPFVVKDISPEDQAMENTIQGRRQKTAELRSNSSFSSTATDEKAHKLEEFATRLMTSFASNQLAAVGHVPQTCNVDEFSYLAETYRLPPYDFLTGRFSRPHLLIQDAFEENASCAEILGNIRLAQTWRILSHVITIELGKRVEINRRQSSESSKNNNVNLGSKETGKTAEAKAGAASTFGVASNANGSPLSTPLARPSHDVSMLRTVPAENLSLSATSGSSDSSSADSQHQQSLVNHPSLSASPDRADRSIPVIRPAIESVSDEMNPMRTVRVHSNSDRIAPFSNFAGLEEHLQESRNVLNSYRARPRTVLNLDGPYGNMQDISDTSLLERHDSNESFQMFSASADSDHQSFPLEDSFDDGRSLSQMSGGSLASFLPSYSRTRLDDLREDDGQSTPLIVEPQELVDHEELPAIEKISSPTKHDLVSQETIMRPDVPRQTNVHKEDFSNDLQQYQPLPDDLWSCYINKTPLPTDPKPWSVYLLLRPLLTYHVDVLFDSQLPTILAIWLWHLFPTEFNRAQITTLILFYHKRLSNLQLHESAARLRKCCALLFPEALEYNAGCTPAIFYCRNCNQALETNATAAGTDYCTRCKLIVEMCSICETDQSSIFSDQKPHSVPNLWTWCQGCGHGGHASCLSEWFSQASISEGACAVLGCNHDCVPGPRREQAVAEMEWQHRRSRKSVVAKDDWTVGESKAVEKARDIVAPESIGRRGGGASNTRGTPAGLQPRRVRLKVDDDNGAALVRTEYS